MRKKLLILMSAVMVFSFTAYTPVSVKAASYSINTTTSVSVSTWDELNDALTDGTANKTIVLTNDIDADSEATTPGNGYYEYGYDDGWGSWVEEDDPDFSITPTITGTVAIDLNGYNLYLGNEQYANRYSVENPTMFNLTKGTDLYIINSKSTNGKVVFSTEKAGSLVKASNKDASLHVYSDDTHPVNIVINRATSTKPGSSFFSIDPNSSNTNRTVEAVEVCGANISIDSYYGSAFDLSSSGAELTPIYIGGDSTITFTRQYSRLCYTNQINTTALKLFNSNILFKSEDNTLFASLQTDSDKLAFSSILSDDYYTTYKNDYTLTNVAATDDLYTTEFDKKTITTALNQTLGSLVTPTLSSANAHYKVNNLYKVTSITEHTLTDINNTAATCTADGHNIRRCDECSQLVDEITPAHGHSIKKIEAKKATCHENGNNAYYHCLDCDKYFTDEAATIETTIDEQVIPASGKHVYDAGKITKEATLTEDGEKTYTCTVCGETKVEKISKLTNSTEESKNPNGASDANTNDNTKKHKNTLTVKGKTVKISAKKLKKKKQTIKAKKAMTIKKAIGNLSYKKTSGNKKITINKKTGKITIKKGLKKKTYKIKIKVTAAGNASYKSGSKTVIIKIKVK